MRCFNLLFGLLICTLAIPVFSFAEEKTPSQIEIADYCKIELRGTLKIIPDRQEQLDPQGIMFSATAGGVNLIFGEEHILASIAKKLDGKTVVINGELRVWSPLTAGPPTQFVHYAVVKSLKAADDTITAEEQTQIAEQAEAEVRLKGLAVSGSLTQLIGYFSTHGRPEIGDSLEIDFDKLPQERIDLQVPEGRGPHYIPVRVPLKLLSLKQAKPKSGPGRAVIHLSASDASGKLLIQVIVESLEKGSKARIILYEDGGFIGSMAEAEGVLK